MSDNSNHLIQSLLIKNQEILKTLRQSENHAGESSRKEFIAVLNHLSDESVELFNKLERFLGQGGFSSNSIEQIKVDLSAIIGELEFLLKEWQQDKERIKKQIVQFQLHKNNYRQLIKAQLEGCFVDRRE